MISQIIHYLPGLDVYIRVLDINQAHKNGKNTYITSPNFLHPAMAEKSFKFLFYTEPNTDFKIDIQGHTRWTLNWP